MILLFLQRNSASLRAMVACCLEVTAPKSVSLPSGPSELHRNPICCHWARPDRTETRFAASTAGAPDVFPDVEPCSIVEFLLCRLSAFRHLSPSAFLALPLPRCSMWAPPCAITPRTRCPLIPRRGTHLASHCRGRVDVRLHVVRPGASRTAMLGSRTLRDMGGVAGLARPRPVTAHARGHAVVGYDR